ncbi:hypothetical protein HGA88_03890 [Candidatus Roizmanbacteria bacterium]|nr:hypothetical protein [Candidatus Roizmanbacteria bacterium]
MIEAEVNSLKKPEREETIHKMRALLASENFDPQCFSQVIGEIGRLSGGTWDNSPRRQGYVTSFFVNNETRRAFQIVFNPNKSENELLIVPDWMALPPQMLNAHGSYTVESTQLLFQLPPHISDIGGPSMGSSSSATPILQLTSTLWFPIQQVEVPDYFGYSHWDESDEGWASKTNRYYLDEKEQRCLAVDVFDTWNASANYRSPPEEYSAEFVQSEK